VASVPSHKLFPAAGKEATSNTVPERGSHRQRKSAHKFRGCEPAFALDLDLPQQQSACTATDGNSAGPDTLDDPVEITHVYDRDEAHEVIRRSQQDYRALFPELSR